MQRDDDGFQWNRDDEQPQDEPYSFEDWKGDDGEPVDPGETFTGAGKPVYEYGSDRERNYSRRSHTSEPKLPLWFFIGIGVLVVLFVAIGILFVSCSHTETTDTGDDAARILDEQVSTTLSGMTTEEKVAQLFFVTPEQLTGADVATEAGEGTKAALASTDVGGIVYSAQNVVSAEQLTSLISTTQSYSKYRLFIGVTEEGGTSAVNTLANGGVVSVAATDDPSTIGASGDSSKAYAAAHVVGGYLSGFGINVDFAPLADTASATTTDPARYFGTDSATVADMTRKSVAGLQGEGVSATLKYFPGSGNTTLNAAGFPSNAESLEEMQANEFPAYSAGIESGADFVMVGNIATPTVSGNQLPASLNPTMIDGTLRGTLGYSGIVISEPMNSATMAASYAPGESAVLFIQAGGDMILMPSDYATAYSAVLAAVQNGTISQERLDQSVSRILHVKLS